MTLPLVSCLMPTKDRRAFAGEAILQFVSQDYYGDLELIVVDGGESVEDLCDAAGYISSGGTRKIRYIREPAGAHNWGQLLEIAKRASAGEVLVNWEDDNDRAPAFVSTLVAALQRYPAAQWAALGQRMRVETLPEHEWYLYRAPAFDATLVIWRKSSPTFTDNTTAGRCLAGCGVVVDRPDLFVMRMHAGKLTGGHDFPQRFKWPRLESGDPALLPPGDTILATPPAPGTGSMGRIG